MFERYVMIVRDNYGLLMPVAGESPLKCIENAECSGLDRYTIFDRKPTFYGFNGPGTRQLVQVSPEEFDWPKGTIGEPFRSRIMKAHMRAHCRK